MAVTTRRRIFFPILMDLPRPIMSWNALTGYPNLTNKQYWISCDRCSFQNRGFQQRKPFWSKSYEDDPSFDCRRLTDHQCRSFDGPICRQVETQREAIEISSWDLSKED